MPKLKIVFIIAFLLPSLLKAQDKWDAYIAQFEKGAGSVVLNMDLIHRSPNRELPFVVITGVTYANCTSEGLPETNEFDELDKISNDLESTIRQITKSELAGSFTYQCERLNYHYVSDTSGIRGQLELLYKNNYPDYSHYINIRHDLTWEAYRGFLYPNEEILEDMSNQKVISQLVVAGDDLSKARKVDHWIYFKDQKARKEFIKLIKTLDFKVEGQGRVSAKGMPYQLRISKVVKLDRGALNSTTLMLRKKAAEMGGDYDGWETIVVKD